LFQFFKEIQIQRIATFGFLGKTQNHKTASCSYFRNIKELVVDFNNCTMLVTMLQPPPILVTLTFGMLGNLV
jgi:hypothetical protein